MTVQALKQLTIVPPKKESKINIEPDQITENNQVEEDIIESESSSSDFMSEDFDSSQEEDEEQVMKANGRISQNNITDFIKNQKKKQEKKHWTSCLGSKTYKCIQ